MEVDCGFEPKLPYVRSGEEYVSGLVPDVPCQLFQSGTENGVVAATAETHPKIPGVMEAAGNDAWIVVRQFGEQELAHE